MAKKKVTTKLRKAVFLDRDGTININVSYMNRVGDFRFLPGVKRGIRELVGAGYVIVIITNQSCIGRGITTEKKLGQIHSKMAREIKRSGGKVDAIYYCPHHPDDGCACRKPQPGMLKKALREMDIDPKKSFMIGDHITDCQAAMAVGCKAILVPEKGHEKRALDELKESSTIPEYVCTNFLEAVRWILPKQNCM